MSALSHDFLGKAQEVWRLNSPGIIDDCIEMDSVSQERTLIEGRISVGILVPSDRPILGLLHVRLLIKYPVSLAVPKSHPRANKPEIPLSLLKEEPFIGLNRMYPNYGDWLLKACRRAGFKPRIAKEADGAASALAFRGGLWGGGGQRAIAENTRQGCGFPQSDARGQSVGACRRRLEARGHPLQSFLNSSTCWLKPVPAEAGPNAPSQQSCKLISLNSWRAFFRGQTSALRWMSRMLVSGCVQSPATRRFI
jgi:DNA-binding transcriptional LysR family regulator